MTDEDGEAVVVLVKVILLYKCRIVRFQLVVAEEEAFVEYRREIGVRALLMLYMLGRGGRRVEIRR